MITYNTGGSPEIIDENTGYIISAGDLSSVVKICNKLDKSVVSEMCVNRAKKYYDQNLCFEKYFNIYESMVKA